ncbi:DUF2628 domain-containing protein [Evansella sp. LMS18]|uniref:DUF2628 domain-containing protein n=1 Tax=Evansella sp. LMS18 TaxID=2924033 RepID=UPI0020D13797|nr:DUF2628 domain-containing protein [Evansella sp. LMS18]UTR08690.1 DUF2628 domain-containing protein [Evansella sp. LMS18]
MNGTSFKNKLNNDASFRNETGHIIKNNSDYYLRKWKTSKNPFKYSGWNWAAFLVSPVWLAYRHMYLWAVIYFVLLLLAFAAAYAFPVIIHYTALPEESLFVWGIVSLFLAGLFFGFKGNTLYAKHVGRIAGFLENKNKQAAPLFNKTGTSPVSAVLVFAAAALLIYPAAVWVSSWAENIPLPEGVYVYEEGSSPPSPFTAAEEVQVFEKYSGALEVLYVGEEPIGDRTFEVVLSHRENEDASWEQLSERSYGFFTSSRVSLHLLDADNPLTNTGEYRVEIFIDQETKGTALFEIVN